MQNGATSKMDTCQMKNLAFLPSRAPVPFSFCPLVLLQSLSGGYHWREKCMLGKAVWGAAWGWSAEGRRGHGCVAAPGPCCLPSLLGAFRSFRVCSAGYCRFIKPQWLKHKARQERGHGWTWTSAPAKQPLANQENPSQSSCEFQPSLLPSTSASLPHSDSNTLLLWMN